MSDSQEKDGVFTGAYAINPMNGERVPVWVAEYVLATYGTGAIMGVPAHDQRDFLFARRYDIPTPVVVVPEDHKGPIPEGSQLEESMTVKEGSRMVNSNEYDGLIWPEGFDRVVQTMEAKGIGEKQVNYRLRDWLISRQRMWGTPIPVIYCPTCGSVPVPYENLPVTLPDDAEFKPTGESPLKYHQEFLHTECHTKHSIRTGGENTELQILLEVHFKIKFDPFTASDPVCLHQPDTFRPFQSTKIEEFVCVFGDP